MFLLTTEFKRYLKQLVHHASTDLSSLPIFSIDHCPDLARTFSLTYNCPNPILFSCKSEFCYEPASIKNERGSQSLFKILYFFWHNTIFTSLHNSS